MMKPRISLIIPVYNVENYLEKCLDSVVFQTIPFYEVILIDDGSTDRSADVCRKYISQYSNLALIAQENKGQSAARNVGIEHASGEYLMFLDSDDWLRRDCVQILSEILEKENVDAIYFDANAISELDNGEIPSNNYDRSQAELDGKLMSGREYFVQSYPKNYVVTVWAGIYKRSYMEQIKIKFPEGICYEDNYFTFAFLSRAEKVLHVSKKLYQRRFRADSTMTSTYSEGKFRDYMICVSLIWDFILKMDVWEEKRILRAFVHDHCRVMLDNYSYCKANMIEISNDGIELLNNSLSKYFYVLNYLKDGSEERELGHFVRLWRNLVKTENLGLKEDFLKQDKEDIFMKLKELYINLLKKLPLDNQKMKIGIYGRGRHTEGLLAMFEALIGEIKCDLYFIDSNTDNEYYKGRNVINYRRLNHTFDYVVISSFLYEKEMLKNIRSIDKEIPVLHFYGDISTDIFSDCFLASKGFSPGNSLFVWHW